MWKVRTAIHYRKVCKGIERENWPGKSERLAINRMHIGNNWLLPGVQLVGVQRKKLAQEK